LTWRDPVALHIIFVATSNKPWSGLPGIPSLHLLSCARFAFLTFRGRYRKAGAVMFTIEQINELHARLGSASTLTEYVRALKALGLERYDSYLADGHSEYFGQAPPSASSRRFLARAPRAKTISLAFSSLTLALF